jgi:hypothetical protein
MADSRSESPRGVLFCIERLRSHPRSYTKEALRELLQGFTGSQRGSERCLARAKEPLLLVIARNAKFCHCEERSDEATKPRAA